jgi:ABC-type polysaccharide/polyol phosphate export permease
MRCLFNCCITMCKFFTDKLIYLLNLLIIIPLTLCIVLKSNDSRGLRDVNWAWLILPIVFIIVFDIFYCLCCKYIYCRERDYNNNLGYSSQV